MSSETTWEAMKNDNRLAAVFPTPDDKGIFVAPETVREGLETELEQYND